MTETVRQPMVLSTSSLNGTAITNSAAEDLGEIEDIMIDLEGGEIAYAVVKFGGFLGMGEKLFAVPWDALTLSIHDEKAILQVSKERLQEAEGFDKDDWPDMADRQWSQRVHDFYGTQPYWSTRRPIQP